MKKKLLAIACLALSCGSAMADAVLTVNGQQVEKAVASLSFDGDDVIISYGDNSSSRHDMGDAVLNFNDITGIGQLTFSKLSVTVGETIVVKGIAPGTTIQVFDIRGRLVTAATSADDECTLDLSGVQPDVYLLRAGNQIVKFVKH
ncbi:MAG: T9SS type A sorting domain-containing protein [Lachnoclostridium sp.]|nr:T9SS type A sorting domain-containing protein [Lachnoclostridium sp.]